MAIRQVNVPQLTPGQASYVLERMIRDRRISAGEVSRYVNDMQSEIDELEQRLNNLREASGGGGVAASRPRPGRPPGGGRAARSPQPSRGGGQAPASQQLQGRYLGLIRQIPENRRARFSQIAKEKGREAAIREMLGVLRKGSTPAGREATQSREQAATRVRKRRSAKLTPERRASQQLQGRYLGLIRQIPAGRRAQITKLAREKGREAAIREMQVILKK